jgi:hypothetical protein
MGFEPGPIERFDLASYGVPAGSFVCLFICDMNSIIERKNPLVFMEAFQQAFQSGEKASLIIKPSAASSYPEQFHRL